MHYKSEGSSVQASAGDGEASDRIARQLLAYKRHRQVHVSAGRERKRVLIVEEEPLARDEMRILLGSSGCECTVASNLQQALATMDQRKFDAVVLDPRFSGSQVTEVISRISESHPNLLRRLVLITEEGKDSVIGELAERYSLPRVQRKLLLQQLWSSLESLFRRKTVFQNAVQVARLISDSFRDPLPAGMRAVRERNRILLYASGNLRVSLLVEPEDSVNRIALTGQIQDLTNRGRRFAGIPVTLQGWKGPVARATTGEFGEFHLGFKHQSSVSLEMGIAESQGLTIPLPPLDPIRRNASGDS